MPKVLTYLLLIIIHFTLLLPQKSIDQKTYNDFVDELKKIDESKQADYFFEVSNYLKDNRPLEGIKFTEDGIKFAKEKSNKELEGELLCNVAFMHIANYDYENALNSVIEGLKIGNELENKKIIGSAYNVLGNYYYKRAIYDKSYDFFLKALKYRIDYGTKKDLASTLNNAGLVLLQLKNYNDANEYFNRSLVIKNELKDYKSILRTMSNLAISYKGLGNFDKALSYIDSGIVICKTQNIPTSLTLFYSIWGDLALLKGDAKSALEKYKEVLKVWNFQKTKKGSGPTDIYTSLGRYFNFIKRYDIAVKYLDTALIIAKNSKLDGYIPNIYNALSDNYELLNDYKMANENRKQFAKTTDSLDNIERHRVIAEMRALYSVEEKDREIQEKKSQLNIAYFIAGCFIIILIFLVWMNYQRKKANQVLQMKNAEISEQKELLTQANQALKENEIQIKKYADELKEIIATKDKFFSIIAHDLRAPYTLILGLTEIMSSESDSFTKEKFMQFSQQLHDTALLQFKLMENLLEWGKLQRGKIEFKPVSFDLFSSVDGLIQIMSGLAEKKKIKINNLVEKNFSIYADKNMMETMIRNIISNSIKFSNADDIITIRAFTTEKSIKVEIEDNGLGIKKNQLDNLFKIDKSISTYGTNKEKGTGLGLILCKELMDIHNGSIDVESIESIGTKVILEFPKS